jgi:hypothetical protein
MSLDEMNDMEQIDGLADELVEAGRLARTATARREQPDPAFAMRLRAELLRELPAAGGSVVATAALGTVPELPIPPARPLEISDRIADRRSGNRPFAGPERRSGDGDAASPGRDGVPVARLHRTVRVRAGRRWENLEEQTASRLSGEAGPNLPPSNAVENDGRVVALKPSMNWHIPTRALPSRWIGAGLAASVAVAALIYGGGAFWSPRTTATTDDALSAVLVRGGHSVALAPGAELRENDEIRVAADGRATLHLGGSYVRMAGGSDVQLKSLDPSHLVVNQVAGRVYHRVVVPAGGDYQVATASVTWQAVGTAFDIDRQSTSGGGEEVRGLALYDGLDVTGPNLHDVLAEGSSATVVLRPDGSSEASPAITPITSQALADAWLIGNAGLDAHLGLPLGRLASLLSPPPTASETDTLAPIETPASVVATATPTSTPKPAVTPKPTPKPTAAGAVLKISRNGDGSYTFSWPKYTGSGFTYYKLMYGSYPSSPSYGTSGDYWACNTEASQTSWTGFIAPGNYSVRLQAIDEPGSKIVIRSQTKIVHLTVGTLSLGSLGARDNGDGTYTFSWAGFTKHAFDYYKLVFETTASGKSPSYPDGSDYWAVPAADDKSVTLTLGDGSFVSGDYHVRIQAIGYPDGFSSGYAFAQTAVLHLVLP